MVMGELMQETEVLVIGGGPGGYSAAFRAADLGMEVTMVDMAERPGGVCLFRGCIPSKTYLHLAELIHDTRRAAEMGITFDKPKIDLKGIRNWKESVIDKMANGLVTLSERRGVQRIKGRAVFESSDSVRIYDSDISHIKFRHAVVATGSHPIPFPGISPKKDGRIMTSTGALDLVDVPESLLIIGGGYVGLEIGTVYASLGSRITVVELTDKLLAGVDPDLVEPLHRRLKELFEVIHLNTKVVSMEETASNVNVRIHGGSEKTEQRFDRVLVGIGRQPNSKGLDLGQTKIKVDDRGFIEVDDQQRTADSKIFAVGDVTGGYMLAHKASREGKVAAEVIVGEPSAFDARAIPAVVYTNPQIAWAGITEEQAKKQNLTISVRRFPWKFSGRATTMGAPEGLTKIIAEPETNRILGVGIVGREAEGLIAEAVLAIEMGALVDDLALSIHAHPTLSETESEAAEIFLGSSTHILPKTIKK
ncbi:MAG TPA: dihydrolipoyl dehydrogenase [Deltaproteobacteria bacterium]|nr:dihydrolipoyl dehydrogenase [Deltaproteobacteria bacterium]